MVPAKEWLVLCLVLPWLFLPSPPPQPPPARPPAQRQSAPRHLAIAHRPKPAPLPQAADPGRPGSVGLKF